MKAYLLLTALLLSMTANAQISVRRIKRQLETSAPKEHQLDLRRGETVDFDLQFLSYGTVMDISGSTVTLHAVTNGMPAGTSFQISGTAASNGTASVRISVDELLPYQLTSGTWTLECVNPSSTRNMSASGVVKLSGLYYPSTNSPLPVTWSTNFWTAISGIQSKTNDWNTAFGWGDHALPGYLTTNNSTYTATVARASSAYSWGDHSAAGYLESSLWLSWLGTNTYIKAESDPTVGAHIKAISEAQITDWNSATGSVLAAYDNTRLIGTDSNFFAMVSATNIVLYQVTFAEQQDETKVKITVLEDLYGDPEIWVGAKLVNAGVYYAPVTFGGDYAFSLTTNSTDGITWSVDGVVDSPLSSFFSQGGRTTYFIEGSGVGYYGYVFPLSDAGFVNYEYDTSIQMGDAYMSVASTNAIATFAKRSDLDEYCKTNHIGNVSISGSLTAGAVIILGSATLGGVERSTWPEAGTSGTGDSAVYKPISTLATGAVVTLVWDTTNRIDHVEVSQPFTLTNYFPIALNCTTNLYKELWVRVLTTNACVNTIYDSRFKFQNSTPEFTCTGLYKFAASTACGTDIQIKQIYPTMHQWERICIGNAVDTDSSAMTVSLVPQPNLKTSGTTSNSVAMFAYAFTKPSLVKLWARAVLLNPTGMIITFGHSFKANGAVPTFADSDYSYGSAITFDSNSLIYSTSFVVPRCTLEHTFLAWNQDQFAIAGSLRIVKIEKKTLNENELLLYNAGKRDF